MHASISIISRSVSNLWPLSSAGFGLCCSKACWKMWRRRNLKIVIPDYRFPDVDQERRAVAAAGGTLVTGQAVNEDQVAELCRDADGVLTVRAPVTRRAISAMQRCRIIVRYGIGVDTVDVAAATERGILVANVPDYCLDEVSDHALTLLLMLSRQMISAISLAREETWAVGKMPPLQRLRGQTCGLIGCGRVGLPLGRKAAQGGMRGGLRQSA